MRFIAAAILGCLLALPVTFAAADSKDTSRKEAEKMVCVTNAELDKIMVEKGYDILLNMKNEDGVVESVWTAGQSVVITAAVPNDQKSCLLATLSNVTFNPKAIEEIWETYKKQTKQKDI